MSASSVTSRSSAPGPRKSGGSLWGMLLKIIVPLVVSVGLCYILFAKQDFGEMVRIVRTECDYRWIAYGLLLNVVALWMRALRWRLQLIAIGVRPTLGTLFLSFCGTYAVNLVFPRLGELWRTGYIAQDQKAPFDSVFGSMVSDRLADTLTVGLLTALTFMVSGSELMRYLDQGSGGSGLAGVLLSPWLWVAMVCAAAGVYAVWRCFRRSGWMQKVTTFVRGLWDGFIAIVRMRGKGLWLLYTLGLWTCYFTSLYLAFHAFPATEQVLEQRGVEVVLVCFVLSSLSMAVPSQGGIGPWQWAVMFGLSLYAAGVPELTQGYAATFANMVMGSQTVLFILLGLMAFAVITLRNRRVNRKENKAV